MKPTRHNALAWEDDHAHGNCRTPSFRLVWVLVFSIPWSDMVLLPYDVQASRVLTLLAFCVWLLSLWRGRRFIAPSVTHLFLMLFILWAGATVFWTVDVERSARRVFSYGQLFLAAWLIFQLVRGRGDYRRLLQAYVLGAYVAFGGLLYNFVIGVSQGDGRFTAPGFDPNDLAATMALGVPAAWYLAFTSHKATWLNRLYIPCALVAALLTASRSGLVTLAVSMLFPLLAMPKITTRAKIGLALVAALCAGSGLYFLSDLSVRRLSTIVDQLTGGDMNGRVEIWQRGWEIFLESPVAGVGGGAFGTIIVGRSGAEVVAHNTFLGVLVEHGFVGLLFFAAIILSLLLRNRHSPSLEWRFWMVTFLAWGVVLSTLSWENRELTWLLWGLCSAQPFRRRARYRPVSTVIRPAYA